MVKKRNLKIKHHWFVAVGLLIPLIVIGVILYLNFLPFGYSKEFVLDVGTSGDDSGVLFLEGAVGSRQELNGTSFRAIDGTATLVFSPQVILRNASVDVSLIGTDVYFVEQPSLDNVSWDYSWQGESFFDDFVVDAPHSLYSQFLNGETVDALGVKPWAVVVNYTALDSHSFLGDALVQDLKTLKFSVLNYSLSYSLPDFYLGANHSVLIGHTGTHLYMFVDSEFVDKVAASMFVLTNTTGASLISMYSDSITETVPIVDGCLVFDGKSRLVYPNSSDMFEVGPFAVWVEWVPTLKNNSQQLVGHFNWEVYQDSDKIQFRTGRMNNNSGPFYSVSSSFNNFNQSNSLLALYSPSDNGYIELFVNGKFAGQRSVGSDVLAIEYGTQDLSLGWTPHNFGNYPYFEGKICSVKFGYVALEPSYVTSKSGKVADGSEARFSIVGNGTLDEVIVRVTQ